MTNTSSDQAADYGQARILGETVDTGMWDIDLSAEGPLGSLPVTSEMLIEEPSGNIFGMTQNAGMGWNPDELLRTRKQAQPSDSGGGAGALVFPFENAPLGTADLDILKGVLVDMGGPAFSLYDELELDEWSDAE